MSWQGKKHINLNNLNILPATLDKAQRATLNKCMQFSDAIII